MPAAKKPLAEVVRNCRRESRLRSESFLSVMVGFLGCVSLISDHRTLRIPAIGLPVNCHRRARPTVPSSSPTTPSNAIHRAVDTVHVSFIS
jgi:hypothetical protein